MREKVFTFPYSLNSLSFPKHLKKVNKMLLKAVLLKAVLLKAVLPYVAMPPPSLSVEVHVVGQHLQ